MPADRAPRPRPSDDERRPDDAGRGPGAGGGRGPADGGRRPAPPPGATDGMRAALAIVVTVPLLSLHHPWSLLAVATSLAAMWFAGRAVALQLRAKRYGWASWQLVGVTLGGYLLFTAALQSIYPTQMTTWSTCTAGANTRVAQAQCDARLDESVPSWLSGALGL
ncbi:MULTISPECIES: hypothetical protein [Arsenicicoccus]|uniref:Uncharacterized protein n=1 Tax=Arsenicicoccus bolidensis TaxID=229480 RepID=A0ABS9Q4U1_9MICO|nr:MULTISPECIES: hypothetical protein [Arsenicicoccus]MCG7322809.1 hypothetical protein [Arsenicicoccus bolidensis]